jgi:Protein of unknown function (DUF3309)
MSIGNYSAHYFGNHLVRRLCGLRGGRFYGTGYYGGGGLGLVIVILLILVLLGRI